MPSVLSLGDAKTHLNLGAGTTYDVELQAFIDSAEQVISNRVGPLQATARTDRVYGTYGLALRSVPAISLTSVTAVNGSALTLGDLYLDTEAAVVRYNSGASFGGRAYDVVYSAGRASCPADLLLAIKELVRHLWESQRGTGTRAGGPMDAAPASSFMLPNRVAELLAPHLSPGFA